MIENLINENIKALAPYKANDYEYIYKLDANENPLNLPEEIIQNIVYSLNKIEFNRYPDTDSSILRKKLAEYIGVDYKNIIAGNGSDQMINLIMNTFVGKGDIVISHIPTFSIYKIVCEGFGGKFIGVNSESNFSVDINKVIQKANENKAKLVFLCTPNNPTGNIILKGDIIKALENTKSIIVVDEAYIEFGGDSVAKLISKYDNLIVLRTLSKAFGLAGIRTGYLVASEKMVDIVNKVKPPYNLNSVSQLIAIEVLKKSKEILNRIEFIQEERENLYNEMLKLKEIEVFPSYANFILFKPSGQNVFNKLVDKGVLIREFKSGVIKGYFRVTIASKKENQNFLKVLKEVINGENS